jgi:hypothetical protein
MTTDEILKIKKRFELAEAEQDKQPFCLIPLDVLVEMLRFSSMFTDDGIPVEVAN